MWSAMQLLCPQSPTNGAYRLDRARSTRNWNVHLGDNATAIDDAFSLAPHAAGELQNSWGASLGARLNDSNFHYEVV